MRHALHKGTGALAPAVAQASKVLASACTFLKSSAPCGSAELGTAPTLSPLFNTSLASVLGTALLKH